MSNHRDIKVDDLLQENKRSLAPLDSTVRGKTPMTVEALDLNTERQLAPLGNIAGQTLTMVEALDLNTNSQLASYRQEMSSTI